MVLENSVTRYSLFLYIEYQHISFLECFFNFCEKQDTLPHIHFWSFLKTFVKNRTPYCACTCVGACVCDKSADDKDSL